MQTVTFVIVLFVLGIDANAATPQCWEPQRQAAAKASVQSLYDPNRVMKTPIAVARNDQVAVQEAVITSPAGTICSEQQTLSINGINPYASNPYAVNPYAINPYAFGPCGINPYALSLLGSGLYGPAMTGTPLYGPGPLVGLSAGSGLWAGGNLYGSGPLVAPLNAGLLGMPGQKCPGSCGGFAPCGRR